MSKYYKHGHKNWFWYVYVKNNANILQTLLLNYQLPTSITVAISTFKAVMEA